MTERSLSFQQATWRRLKKNKGAVFGMIVILLSILAALLAYFIAPDNSPYANRIILETGGEKPGFSQQFLLVKNEKNIEPPGLLKQLVAGKEDKYFYIPINSYVVKGDSIIVDKYIDEGISERQSYLLSMTAEKPVVTKKFLLGTDKYGRDIFSRLVVGTRVSLSV